ncbi:glutamine amidotransferase-related protein [Haliangium ochraceum]|uniref:Glutamine amidotransferase class-I n=1 Tax=Haliangium ochraceum (strain DSM 14365 / JCM 11303 / SMP-2) TaxID=502025 RepID=D0LYD5_HALO1|nr:gamma-glutamyl-gamma-aminobutyrate hydrolase family protein [Haliangium ochraceum]ACY16285.1 glutamine amidotransferase class-I [Haliangium ochraceum DSM 14365]
MSRKQVLLYVVGAPSEDVRAEFGTYIDWFARLFAAHDIDVRFFDGHLEAGVAGHLSQLRGVDGVVITGSAASLTVPEPWMDATSAMVQRAHGEQMPLLGVCFGHQVIGAALGGRVIRNPRGWQLASADIELNEHGRGDPLFAGLDTRFRVNLSHQDIVCETSLASAPQLRVLAGNPKAAIQALAAGPNMRGVQFHPEFSGPITSAYIKSRHAILAADAHSRQADEDHPDLLLAQVCDSPEGEAVLHNFLTHFVAAQRH